jgi:hypothetical protein
MVGKATLVDETIKGERKDEAVVIKRAIRFTLASLFLSLVNGCRNYLLSVSLGQARRRQTKISVIVSKVQMEVEMPHPSVLLPHSSSLALQCNRIKGDIEIFPNNPELLD